jgi:predicted ABC-type transport system involved in lysophospholipase L1 biosynthesis ATPase subunit
MLTGVHSLDQLSFFMAPEMQAHEDVEVGAGVEVEEVQEEQEGASAEAEVQEVTKGVGVEEVEVRASGGVRRPRIERPNSKRQKKFQCEGG